MEELASTEKLSLFTIPSVKQLIVFQWQKVYFVILNKLFYPYLATFVLMHVYFLYAFEN